MNVASLAISSWALAGEPAVPTPPPARATVGVAITLDAMAPDVRKQDEIVDLAIEGRYHVFRYWALGALIAPIGSAGFAPRVHAVAELHLHDGLDGAYVGAWGGSRFGTASNLRDRGQRVGSGPVEGWPYAGLVIGSRPVLHDGLYLDLAVGWMSVSAPDPQGRERMAGPMLEFDVGRVVGPGGLAADEHPRGLAVFGTILGGFGALGILLAVGASEGWSLGFQFG